MVKGIDNAFDHMELCLVLQVEVLKDRTSLLGGGGGSGSHHIVMLPVQVKVWKFIPTNQWTRITKHYYFIGWLEVLTLCDQDTEWHCVCVVKFL